MNTTTPLVGTPGLVYLGGLLHLAGQNLAVLAKQYGTPLWVYDGDQIASNYWDLADAFSSVGAEIRYAVKANDAMAILKLLDSLGSGFDVVSGGELFRVEMITDGHCETTCFAGAAKNDAELAMALDYHVGIINAESLQELAIIGAMGAERGVRPKVALRVAPGVDPHTLEKISTSHEGTKFGIELAAAEELLAMYHQGDLENIQICGIHCHAGSQLFEPAVYGAVLDKILPLFAKFDWLETLDLGGGFPVAYNAPEEKPVPPIEEYVRMIDSRIEAAGLGRRPKLFVEPGRSIVANAGILLVEVESAKKSGDVQIVTCNGGMATLVRPAMYGSYHEIMPVKIGGVKAPVDIAGPHCESSDYLGKAREMPLLARYDLLAVLNAGAYGRTMSSNYNTTPLAGEVMIREGQISSIRDPQTYESMLAGEKW